MGGTRGAATADVTHDDGGIGGTGVDPELLERLLPHLAESIMVLDDQWNVTANLAPPGGLIGRGLGLGVHTLEDMHPDDALHILDLGQQAFTTEDGWEGSMVVRMQRGDGTYGRYEVTAVNRFADPVVHGMVVRTREIPHESEPWVPGLEHRLAVEVLAELLPTGVIVLDASGRPVYANGAACGLLHQEPEDLKRSGLLPLVVSGDRARLEGVLARVTAVMGRETCRVRLAGGAVVEVSCSSVGEPEVSLVVVTVEDVTQRHEEERDLERRASHDDLTGVRNRASLLDLLRDRSDTGAPTAVAYLDLDGFKRVNDAAGHAAGDRLLVAVADALVARLGAEVEVGRIGGDEFVVVAEERRAATLAAEARDVVATVAAGWGVEVSCSVGVAVAEEGDGPRDVLHRADEEMYLDKRARRGTDGG